jgi:hypothetical protein
MLKKKASTRIAILLSTSLCLIDVHESVALATPIRQPRSQSTQLLSSLKDPPSTEKPDTTDSTPSVSNENDSEGLPWWWELVWDLDIMKRGKPGEDVIFGDNAHVLRTNIEQIYGGYPSLDGCPLAEGEITDIADGTMFIGLQTYQKKFASPFKLCFGPKSFLVVSDPMQARHILKDANTKYDKVRPSIPVRSLAEPVSEQRTFVHSKGLLAEILEPIMGKGLIPADPKTWSVRRRQIVPAFHKVSEALHASSWCCLFPAS